MGESMNEQAWWVIAIVAVVTSGVIGFFIGRAGGGAGRGRVDELEAALAREKAALEAYKEKVDAHFDKTAGLFVSMAGSYKSLFDHLANGYEELAPGSARGVFKERIETLLAAPLAPAADALSEPAATDLGKSTEDVAKTNARTDADTNVSAEADLAGAPAPDAVPHDGGKQGEPEPGPAATPTEPARPAGQTG